VAENSQACMQRSMQEDRGTCCEAEVEAQVPGGRWKRVELEAVHLFEEGGEKACRQCRCSEGRCNQKG